MGEKNNKNKETQFEAEEINILIYTEAINLLLHNKTPGYEKRFKGWAKNTQGEHLTNLANAILSSAAQGVISGKVSTVAPNTSVEFIHGMTHGVIMMLEFVKLHASETVQNKDDEFDDASDLLNND